MAIVRGDHELNETKLANAVKATDLRPMTEDEIANIKAVPGYGSPIGVSGATVVVDDLVAASANLVAGANEEGYHFLNSNHGRDYTADVVADITAASDGDPCVVCGSPLRTTRGVETGNIFKLGTPLYRRRRRDVPRPGRTAAPDRHGQLRHRRRPAARLCGRGAPRLPRLCLPITIAPAHVHLCRLGAADHRPPRSPTGCTRISPNAVPRCSTTTGASAQASSSPTLT